MVHVLHARGVLVAFATVLTLSELVLSVDTSDGGHCDKVASERTVGGVSGSCIKDCIWTAGLQHDRLFETRRLGRMRIEQLFGGVHRPKSTLPSSACGMAFSSVTATAC